MLVRDCMQEDVHASFYSSSCISGLLYALGLRGHLRVLSHSDICDYLTQVRGML